MKLFNKIKNKINAIRFYWSLAVMQTIYLNRKANKELFTIASKKKKEKE